MKAALLLVITVSLAGCGWPPTDIQAVPDLDGESAWDRLDAIVYDGEELRPRHPQHPGHDETAAWLAEQARVDGWTVTTESFSGARYLALDRSLVSRWSTCSEEDTAELPGLLFHNIYAHRPLEGAPRVWLAAHWDAKEDAHGGGPVPAANDGAAGVALLLEMQRYLAHPELHPPVDLTIVFFDGEDGFEDCHPLAGSLYAAQTRDEGELPDLLVLLDMIGDRDARFIRETRSVESAGGLVDVLESLAPHFGLGPNFVSSGRTIADDHAPFAERGVPAIDIIDAGRTTGFPPYWHTTEDTPDKVDPDMLAAVGGLVLGFLNQPEVQQIREGIPAAS